MKTKLLISYEMKNGLGELKPDLNFSVEYKRKLFGPSIVLFKKAYKAKDESKSYLNEYLKELQVAKIKRGKFTVVARENRKGMDGSFLDLTDSEGTHIHFECPTKRDAADIALQLLTMFG